MRIDTTLFLAALFCAESTAATVKISVLATTDLHGYVLPYDYYTARPAARGLAKVSKLVESARLDNPNSLLIDCGDTIQGSPLEAVYQHYVRTGRLPLDLPLTQPLTVDPVMQAMNAMRYDAMTLGNHEFNFGLKNLDRARADARFPFLSANTSVLPGSGNRPLTPYIVKEIAGVKVAVIGVTTPAIPNWEEPDHYRGYTFQPILATLQRLVPEVRASHRPDLVIVAAHSGLGVDPRTGTPEPAGIRGENAVYEVAMKVPGIDAIVFGHTHGQVESLELNGVLIMQPKNWAFGLGRMDFSLDNAGGRWSVKSKSSQLFPVTSGGPIDEKIVELTRPYHEAAERYLNSPVAATRVDLSSTYSRVEDTAILDAIHAVQLDRAKADVSLTAAFNQRVRIPAGPVTVRQIAALYLYENTLVAIEGNGRMLREALENAARFYLPCNGDCSSGPRIDRRMAGFNYDMAQGVDYVIDVSQPIGQRIRNLRRNGKPIADDTPLRIAVNNYRAGGSGGYTMFRNAKVVWRSNDEIRDMIVRYYVESKSLPEAPDNNWKVVPEAALDALRREASADALRSQTQ